MSNHKLFPCGQSRREFVWEMGGGFAGLALANVLAGDGFFQNRACRRIGPLGQSDRRQGTTVSAAGEGVHLFDDERSAVAG